MKKLKLSDLNLNLKTISKLQNLDAIKGGAMSGCDNTCCYVAGVCGTPGDSPIEPIDTSKECGCNP
jgi:hypothetical protein